MIRASKKSSPRKRESGGQITRPIKPEALKSVALNLWIIETVKQCCSVAKIQCGSALRSLAARTH